MLKVQNWRGVLASPNAQRRVLLCPPPQDARPQNGTAFWQRRGQPRKGPESVWRCSRVFIVVLPSLTFMNAIPHPLAWLAVGGSSGYSNTRQFSAVASRLRRHTFTELQAASRGRSLSPVPSAAYFPVSYVLCAACVRWECGSATWRTGPLGKPCTGGGSCTTCETTRYSVGASQHSCTSAAHCRLGIVDKNRGKTTNKTKVLAGLRGGSSRTVIVKVVLFRLRWKNVCVCGTSEEILPFNCSPCGTSSPWPMHYPRLVSKHNPHCRASSRAWWHPKRNVLIPAVLLFRISHRLPGLTRKVVGILLLNVSDQLERAREVLRLQPRVTNVAQAKKLITLGAGGLIRVVDTPAS